MPDFRICGSVSTVLNSKGGFNSQEEAAVSSDMAAIKQSSA